MVTAGTDIRPVPYMCVDMCANVVNVEGAGTVGTGKDLLADLEVEQVLCSVGKDERAVAAAPREFVVAVHWPLLLWLLGTLGSLWALVECWESVGLGLNREMFPCLGPSGQYCYSEHPLSITQ